MDDWETSTKIGKNVRPGGAAADRQTVIRGAGNLNAAKRSGNVTTEKKYASSNTKASTEGQHLTKVDRSDDIVKLKTVGTEVGQAIQKGRKDKGIKNQAELAKLCNTTPAIIQQFESGKAAPDQKVFNNLERVLGIKLRGEGIGQPKTGPGKKGAAAAPAAAKAPAPKTTIKIVPPGAASAASPKTATPKTATPKTGTPTSGTVADLGEEEA